MVSFSDYEDMWYEREADGFRMCNKWRHGRKYLFELDRKKNLYDFEKRIMADRKLRGYLKETDVAREQGNYCERMEWNHKFPNWLNYRELHMHNKIVL